MTTSQSEIKVLSQKVAQRCEDAKESVCKCRCGGALHGARRGDVLTLPYGDPHSLIRKCRKCDGTGKRYAISSGTMITLECGICKGKGLLIIKNPQTNL